MLRYVALCASVAGRCPAAPNHVRGWNMAECQQQSYGQTMLDEHWKPLH